MYSGLSHTAIKWKNWRDSTEFNSIENLEIYRNSIENLERNLNENFKNRKSFCFRRVKSLECIRQNV